MPSRRDFIKTSGLALAGLSISKINMEPIFALEDYQSKRPPLDKRKFTSQAVEAKIAEIKNNVSNKEISWLFENCFPNTLDTTVKYQILNGRPDTFVITGDINAMWLRDSSAQVWPYLPLIKDDEKLKKLIAGVINRQTKCILIDPYANAFNYGPTGSEWDKDLTTMKPQLHERKWEIDSLCYPIRLAHEYWKTTGDTSPFDAKWLDAMKLVVKTFRQQQRKNGHGPYKFERITPNPTDTLPGGGYGNPIKPVGLICSMFRPSDDATIYPFLVPSNYFAVKSLRQLSEMSVKIKNDKTFSEDCNSLANEVEEALQQFAIIHHLDFGDIFPYEVDGFGNRLFMDDANVPSLLSLPYLDCVPAKDTIYKNTRHFVLSSSNPYFFKGTAAEGVGSPHTGLDKIWPIGIMIRAFTSDDNNEISECLNMLVKSNAGTGFMHESFNMNNPADFTRKWFAWANTLFGELILKLYNEKPQLLNL